MSHISTYRLAPLLPSLLKDANLTSEEIRQREAEARKRAEELILSELQRSFLELAERQEDAAGNLRLLLKVNPQAAPEKTGEVEVVIKPDQTLTLDVSNAPGKACKELTQPLEMALGAPVSVHYKKEYYESKVRLPQKSRGRV